jgi:hypothetical protein
MKPIRLVVVFACAAVFVPLHAARGQYDDWRQRAVFPLLSTPHGADLPAAAREENFPVLVRLDGENFEFSEA